MDKKLLLTSRYARHLYEKYAKNLPVIDYHNHLSLKDIENNKPYKDAYELWIQPDPYKHRAMRMCGVSEEYITGSKHSTEKFQKWCETLPRLKGNPLYIWVKMELAVVFGINEEVNGENWEKIYLEMNRVLTENDITPQVMFEKFNAEYVCPCASFTDDVYSFKDILKVSPSLRADNALQLDKAFIEDFAKTQKKKFKSVDEYIKALEEKVSEYVEVKAKFADLGIDNGFKFYVDDGKNGERFLSALKGEEITQEDKVRFYSFMVVKLGQIFAKQGMVLQLHIGAERWTSSRLRKLAGPAGGFAGIGGGVDVKSLTMMLDEMEKTEYGLPKIILFTLNPADNAVMSVLSGSYSKDNVEGLITQGPAWWWCDHKYGIEEVFENVATFGVLENFVGMTTDSRSFLSLVRHDYFRRVLCSWLAEKVKKNELPKDEKGLERIIQRLCYENTKKILRG